ncbi:MAG: DUF2726 domain-containing protein [Halochromatium sp.]
MLIGSLLDGRGARLRGAPFERRPLLSADERRCHRLIQQTLGEDYPVFPRVAASALLRPLPRIGRRQRRLALAHLRAGWADLLICSAADAYPLVVVRLVRETERRAQRRSATRMRAAFAAAGMPVLELNLNDLPTPARLATLIQEALAMNDPEWVPARRARQAPTLRRADADEDDEDEAAFLSQLTAAMRDPEVPSD